MLFRSSAAVGGCAFLVALFVTPLALRLGKSLDILDRPGGRKIHREPIPYLGGLAFFCAWAAALVVLAIGFPSLWRTEYWGLFLGGLCICLLGSFDDIRAMGAWGKLPVEILIVLLLYLFFDIRIDKLSNPLGGSFDLGWLGIPVTIFWYLGVMNAINLSDGLDGLAAGIACIASLTMFITGAMVQDGAVCAISAALFGMTLAFLKYNFHPAKVFMGDMGALFLGFMLASVAVLSDRKSSTTLPLLVPIIALGVSILDTTMAIVRRLWRRVHIFQADREHLHHRLMGLGLSHRQTVLLVYYFCAYLSISSLVLSGLGTRQTVLVLLVLGMGLLLAMLALEFIERKAKDLASKQCASLLEQETSNESGNPGRRSSCNQLLFPRLRTRARGRLHRPRRRSGSSCGAIPKGRPRKD